MRDNNSVVIGGTYKHFKGGLYKVLHLATDEENRDGDKLVIYQSISDGEIWARKKSIFTSSVDVVKYPSHAGQYRFTFIG